MVCTIHVRIAADTLQHLGVLDVDRQGVMREERKEQRERGGKKEQKGDKVGWREEEHLFFELGRHFLVNIGEHFVECRFGSLLGGLDGTPHVILGRFAQFHLLQGICS